MKRKLTILLLCLLTLLICSCSKHTAKAEATEETESSTTESEVPTPKATSTPASTYTPGDDLYGMLSVTGEVVIVPQYNYLGLFTEENLARFQDYETGLWGYINESGEEVIPAQYEDAQDFLDGLAAVETDGLYGFIDVSGEMVIEPQFEGVGSEFAYERCVIQSGGLQGVIDQTGVSIVKPQYKSIEMYCESYFIVQSSEGEYGIIDRDGEVVVEYLDSEIYAVTDSGYYFVSGSYIDNKDLMCDFAGNQYYVESYSLSYPLYQIHSDSKIAFSSDGMIWGLMDLSCGEVILEEVYDSVYVYMAGSFANVSSGEVDSKDNLAYVSREEEAGLINISTGETVVDCVYQAYRIEYEYIEFEDANDKWGLMDLDGNVLFEAKYDSIQCSPYGEFAVRKNDASYIVDIDENILREVPDRYVLDFVDAVDCWLVSDREMENEDTAYSALFLLVRRDGTPLISSFNVSKYIDYYDYYHTLGQYPNPIDSSTAPFIVSDYEDDGTESSSVLINSAGYVFGCPLGLNYWFPDQGVLVVTKDGKDGLISYDGTVLFPVQECHIFTNKSAGEEAETYEYDTYNDTDYLIYTIPAK